MVGSVIRPASFNANWALKPTQGAINRGERQGFSQSTIGVHAGCAIDMWAVAVEIAKRCNLALTLGKAYLPNFPTPDGVGTHGTGDLLVGDGFAFLEDVREFLAVTTAVAALRTGSPGDHRAAACQQNQRPRQGESDPYALHGALELHCALETVFSIRSRATVHGSAVGGSKP